MCWTDSYFVLTDITNAASRAHSQLQTGLYVLKINGKDVSGFPAAAFFLLDSHLPEAGVAFFCGCVDRASEHLRGSKDDERTPAHHPVHRQARAR
eukprot:SAG31_NODE_3052_length_4740_cov_1.733894_5_plen_95_part_00